jgi:phosphomannomutase
MVTASTAEVYRCPGENYDITRAVHLARLAVSYSKCRTCPRAPGAVVALESPTGEPEFTTPLDASLFTSEGIRGRYLNDLTRATAAQIAGAMASCLWDDFAGSNGAGTLRVPSATIETGSTSPAGDFQEPLTPAESDPVLPTEGLRLLAPGRPGPCVVLAHDERPSSPDIVTGVGQSLRRMGCQVVDIGLSTRPCLMFAIDHLHAAGGVHVTGAGCDPGWTGLDFLSRGAIPCSSPGELDRIRRRYDDGYSRPSRRPGSQRTFHAAVPYEAGLWKYFHALRPLKISVACPSRTLRDLFARAFRKVSCRLLPVETPTRRRAVLDPGDPDVERTARHVREAQAHLGVLVDDDGERCAFFDEQGRLVAPALVAGLLAADCGASSGRGAVGESQVPDASRGCPPSREAIAVAMQRDRVPFAADGAGRYWIADAYPACDALLTLVYLLQALSRSDTPFSEVVQ